MLPSIFGENLFDDFFDDPFERDVFGARNPLYGKHAKNLMKTDVKEKKDGYEIAIDLFARGLLTAKGVVTHFYSIDEWKAAFEMAKSLDSIKVVIKP